mgnify:CR=1 FL=1
MPLLLGVVLYAQLDSHFAPGLPLALVEPGRWNRNLDRVPPLRSLRCLKHPVRWSREPATDEAVEMGFDRSKPIDQQLVHRAVHDRFEVPLPGA